MTTLEHDINELISTLGRVTSHPAIQTSRYYEDIRRMTDSVILFTDTITSHEDVSLTSASISTLAKLEQNYIDSDLSTIQPSNPLEVMLIEVGIGIWKALKNAHRPDELKILQGSVIEYAAIASRYGTATGRVPEHFGVSLNEALLFKLTASRQHPEAKDPAANFDIYAAQFLQNLQDLQENLNDSNTP